MKNWFKKITGNKNEASFDDKLNELLTSMIEICLEYVKYDKTEIAMTYAHGSLEDSISFDYVYEIDGRFAERHTINDFTVANYDTSDEMQLKVLRVGIDDMTALSELFKSDNRQVPTHIIIGYNNKSGEFKSKFFYDAMLGEQDMADDITLSLIEKLMKD